MLQTQENNNQVFYAVKVNGLITSKAFPDRNMASVQIQNLSESQQFMAQIVPVTSTGQEMLFG